MHAEMLLASSCSTSTWPASVVQRCALTHCGCVLIEAWDCRVDHVCISRLVLKILVENQHCSLDCPQVEQSPCTAYVACFEMFADVCASQHSGHILACSRRLACCV